ncbi:DUF3106 domain-containing protein, partial [Ramlibacter sp. 2FC]|uniref:DUF3106 domain-containing protein n=1 Tax=Ramlibacter sp. 2FC TaxID=2502188 RepID=UPI0010F542BE
MPAPLLACLAALALASGLAAAQPVPPAKPASAAAGPGASVKPAPGWNALSAGQKQALRPLAGTWNSLSDQQQRKWLALSRNFAAMSPAEQDTLHSRMTEWAALSPLQRSQARLNFAETRKLPADEKKAKWEAYQALSPEERHKLASRTAKPAGAALAVRPVPPQKLALPPEARSAARRNETPGTAIPPQLVHQNTLLPRLPP